MQMPALHHFYHPCPQFLLCHGETSHCTGLSSTVCLRSPFGIFSSSSQFPPGFSTVAFLKSWSLFSSLPTAACSHKTLPAASRGKKDMSSLRVLSLCYRLLCLLSYPAWLQLIPWPVSWISLPSNFRDLRVGYSSLPRSGGPHSSLIQQVHSHLMAIALSFAGNTLPWNLVGWVLRFLQVSPPLQAYPDLSYAPARTPPHCTPDLPHNAY